jgi:hypothetical protein
MITTLPKAIWRTPADWSDQQVFCTEKQLFEMVADLNANGMEDAVYCDAGQYILVGDATRGVPRGWYHQLSYGTADGRTTWNEHCVLLDSNLDVIRENFVSMPQPSVDISAAERSILMRCVINA